MVSYNYPPPPSPPPAQPPPSPPFPELPTAEGAGLSLTPPGWILFGFFVYICIFQVRCRRFCLPVRARLLWRKFFDTFCGINCDAVLGYKASVAPEERCKENASPTGEAPSVTLLKR